MKGSFPAAALPQAYAWGALDWKSMAGTAPDGHPVHSELDFHPENRSYRFPALGSLLNARETAFHSRRFPASHACVAESSENQGQLRTR